jgi:hypothetical protein
VLPSSSGAWPRALVALGVVLALLAVPLAALAQSVGPSPTPIVTPSKPTPTPSTPPPPDVGPPLPDLVVSSVAAHLGADERSPTQVCATVTNIGYDPNAAVPRSTTGSGFEVYIKLELGFVDDNGTVGWAFEAENFARQDTPLPGGPSSTTDPTSDQAQFCWNFTIPAGNYRWYVLADDKNEVQESHENNNANAPQRATFTVKGIPTPDLIVSRLVVTPRDARPGDYQAFQFSVMNRGNATTGSPTHVELRDETGLLARMAVAVLPAGHTQSFVFLTQPDLRPPGSYFVVATVDPENNVTEYNESNNQLGVPYSIGPHPEPDLGLANVTLNGTLINGTLEARHGIRLDGQLVDTGNASVTNASIQLLLDGVPAKNLTIPQMVDVGKPANFSFYFVLSPGNHTIALAVDPNDVLIEFDKTNNNWTQALSIAPASEDLALPNLVLDRLDAAPRDPAPNETVSITGLVENLGTKRSNDTTVALYLGTTKLGTVHVGPVSPDRSVSFRFPWGAPPLGPYELRAEVDPDNAVNETDETDNNYTLPFEIVPPPAPPSPVTLPNGTLPGDDGTTPGGNATPPVVLTPTSNGPLVELPLLDLSTRPVPGGVKGVVKVSLRNPTIEPLGRITVTFSVDGKSLDTRLVSSIDGAGTTSLSSDEMDLPPGTHTLTVSALVIGPGNEPVNATKDYTAEAGAKNLVPLGWAPIVGGALAAAAILWPRRKQ